MKQRFTINLATLIEEMVHTIFHSDEIDTDESGVWCTLNGKYLLVTWADLIDIRDSADFKQLADEIQTFMGERGMA